MLNAYLSKFAVRQLWNKHEVAHSLLPKKDVLYSYVIEDPIDHKITGFFSFYSLPSSVLQHEKHKTLYAAYQFYHATDAVKGLSNKDLMSAAIYIAKQEGFDVFNALDVCDN